MPVPLPAHYVVGIDVQQRDFEHYFNRSYVRGTWSETGWWWYYGYVLLVKLPTGSLALLACAAVATCRIGRGKGALSLPDALCLLAPPAVIFAVASLKSGFSEHGRYVLPCLPFLHVWAGGLFARPGRLRLLSTLLLVAAVGESLIVWPHSLAFFNLPAGGVTAGPAAPGRQQR